MSRYVVDASVAIKWLLPEVHSESALRLLEPAHELMAPDLFPTETANVLRKKVRLRQLTLKEGRRILLALQAEIAAGLGRTVYTWLLLYSASAPGGRGLTLPRESLLGFPRGGHTMPGLPSGRVVAIQ